jgi:predicted GIY-YIG superfamily endonuclease
MSNIYRFFRLSRNEKWLFLEAAYETLQARIVTSVCSIRQYVSWLGQENVETAPAKVHEDRKGQIMRIKTAMIRCRHLVWARKCLVESIAVKRMLRRRHIPATLYLGVAKDNQDRMTAHAWVRSGNIWLTGGRNRHRFTVVGFFS